MSKPNELLGVGGMIFGRLPAIESVARALDLEGEKVAEERTGNVLTPTSAYVSLELICERKLL
jgi:hypothetical protein